MDKEPNLMDNKMHQILKFIHLNKQVYIKASQLQLMTIFNNLALNLEQIRYIFQSKPIKTFLMLKNLKCNLINSEINL